MSPEQEPTADDARAASSLTVSLSSYIVTASIAIFGAQAVVVNSMLGKGNNSFIFVLVAILAALFLVASVYCGGSGIWHIIQNGAKGQWTITSKRLWFAWQVTFSLAGALLVVASSFIGY
jgi:hypothetical protein